MSTNQYYGFAVGVSANALTPSAFAALTTLRTNGFQPGVASSEQMNTVWRQASVGAAGVAQFAANWQAADVLDDGSPVNFAAALEAAIKAVIAAHALPVGVVQAYFGSTTPAGWLECNGALVLKTDYPALYAKRSAWGGSENVSYFSLPDLRGEFLRGWDHGRGVDAGRALGTAQTEEVGSHTHAISGTRTFALSIDDMTGTLLPPVRTDIGSAATTITDANTGTESRPRNVAVMFIIKT